MAQLPIRALTLYKQGIGFFQRRGTVATAIITLTVSRASLNDVLKSLDIVVHAGGPVQSVDYETPADKDGQLADLSIKLAQRAGLVDLFTSLRGAAVQLRLADDITLEGRVLGVEDSLGEHQTPIVVLQCATELRCVLLTSLVGLRIDDAQAAADVAFLLDLSRTEQTRTTLTVRLAPGTHDLALHYTAPCPTWRVSYRLVADGQGSARLVGWGLFDNTLDEDLDDVDLTLISGRPVSFTYDLAATRVPPRPLVADDPTALEAAVGDRSTADAIATLSHEFRTPLTVIRGYADLLTRDQAGPLSDDQRTFATVIRDNAIRLTEQLNHLLDVARLRDTTSPTRIGALFRPGPLGDLKVSSSYFLPVEAGNADETALVYEAATPISVRRGQAALVPLLDAQVAVTEQVVFNGAKMAHHPLKVARFRNTTGVALEQGPITVMRSGRYQGEGLVRFRGVDDELQIAYALEFGILVRETQDYLPRTLAAVRFNSEHRRAEVDWAHITRLFYQLSSNSDRAIEVLIERRNPLRGSWFEVAPPTEEQEGHTRWAVPLAAHAQAELRLQEREIRTAYEQVEQWSAAFIEELHAAGGFDATTYTRLQRLLTLGEAERANATQTDALDTELEQIRLVQDQLRKNLGALGTSEREGVVRDRLLDDLEASEARRRVIAETLRDLAAQTRTQTAGREAVLTELYQPVAA